VIKIDELDEIQKIHTHENPIQPIASDNMSPKIDG
jgi:hypothetical protein